jgi:hypothetical protein
MEKGKWVTLVLSLLVTMGLMVVNPVVAQELELIKLEDCLNWFKQDPGEPQFKPGDVLTYKDIEKLKPWIPREFWSAIFFPEMEMKIGPTRDYSPHPAYLEATKKFGGQTKIGPKGELVNYVAGYPFPPDSINLGDPQAGTKLVWNWDRRWQNEGLGIPVVEVRLMSPGGRVDRAIGLTYKRLYYNHRADLSENNYTIDAPDAKEFQYKEWVQAYKPFDIKDTTFVTFRYVDFFKKDDAWAYVPALRRVRRLSMAARADSFLGTEYTMDDFYNFAGRPLEWEWKLIARRKMLVPLGVDTESYKEFYGPLKLVPHTRWEIRDTWVVENIPKWDRHPYSRKLFYCDAQTMYSTWTSAWDKKNDLWKGFVLFWYWSEDGYNPINKGLRLPVVTNLITYDYQNNKGTIVWIGEEGVALQGIPGESKERISGTMAVKYFDINRLTRGR